MASKSSKFGFGLLIGTAIGAAAAFFLSPKSGKENREMAQKKMEELQALIEEQGGTLEERITNIYGTVNEKSTKAYQQLRKETKTRMGQMQQALEDLDVEKYKGEVLKIVETLKKDGGTTELIDKAQKFLMTYVDKITQEEAPKKPAAKKEPAKPAKKEA